jgi:branched-chain amino acid transport system permease protein
VQTFLQQIINGLSLGAIYALIALGYTMVYGVLRLINFAHGDVYMLGAFAGYFIANALQLDAHPSVLWAIVVTIGSMATCAAIGILIERFAYRPVRHHSRLTSLITAIGVSLLLENGGRIVFGADPKFFPQIIVSKNIALGGGVTISNQQVIILVVSIVLMVLLRLIVMHTRVGKAMQAVSFNPMAASLMGISVDRIVTFTFMLGSMLAAAAGVLVALQNPKIEPLMGIMPGLKAFTAAVLGGIGIIPGAVLGALIMGVVESLTSSFISSSLRDAVSFGILILVLLLKPTGILGKSETEKV